MSPSVENIDSAMEELRACVQRVFSAAEKVKLLINESILVHPRIPIIKTVVAKYYGFHESSLVAHNRSEEFVKPRHIAIFLCAELTPAKANRILPAFERDLSLFRYAIRTVRNRLETERSFQKELDEVRQLCSSAIKEYEETVRSSAKL